jgi:hypothetical protein
VINADNVAKYYNNHVKDCFDVGIDIPTIAPPFDKFFVDISDPGDTFVVGKEKIDLPNKLPRWGVLYDTFDLIGLSDTEKSVFCIKLFEKHGSKFEASVRDRFSNTIKGGETRWVLHVTLFIDPPMPVDGFISIDGLVWLNSDGVFQDNNNPFAFYAWPLCTLTTPELSIYATKQIQQQLKSTGEINNFVAMHIQPTFLAISFMHCKNANIQDIDPKTAYTRQERRQQERKHNRPLCVYKTIEIEPIKKPTKNSTDSSGKEFSMPLHICRGHFRTYTENSKLFGRLVGTFWIPQHTKGSLEHGANVNDYMVKNGI